MNAATAILGGLGAILLLGISVYLLLRHLNKKPPRPVTPCQCGHEQCFHECGEEECFARIEDRRCSCRLFIGKVPCQP